MDLKKKISTSHAIISLIENVKKSVDDKQIACGVFIDLEKEFDTVDHTLLLNKLSYCGIRSIANKWFKSYLRSQNTFFFLKLKNTVFLHKTMEKPYLNLHFKFRAFFPCNEDMKILSFSRPKLV